MASSGSFNTTAYDGRYLHFSWSQTSQSIDDNTTTISWSLKGAGGDSDTWYYSGNFKVVINGTTVYSSSDRIKLSIGTTVASGSVTIRHNTNGTKSFSASAEAGIYAYAVNCTGSGNFTLNTIARKSTLTASDGTLGTAQTLTINRASSNFTHTISYVCGTASGTIVTKTSSTSVSWTPALSLASQNTTGTTVSVTFTITTYNGSTNLGSNTTTISCSIPASVKPSCTITAEDTTTATTLYGDPVQNLSKIKITVTPTLAYGSGIASYSVDFDGQHYTKASFTTGALINQGPSYINVTIKDKRGRSYSTSLALTVQEYNAPKVTKLTVNRCNSDGTGNEQGEYCKVTFSAALTNVCSLNVNTATYKLKYKRTQDSSYTTVTLTNYSGIFTVTNGTYIFAADSGHSYDVVIIASDRHKSATKETSVSTAFSIMHFGSDGRSMAMGKVSERPGSIEMALPTYTAEPIILDDDGWVSLTPTSDFKIYDNNTTNYGLRCRKTASGVVQIDGAVSPASANNNIGSATTTTICTLPVGYRPTRAVYQLQQGTTRAIWLLSIATNGEVRAARYRDETGYVTPGTSVWMNIFASFLTL